MNDFSELDALDYSYVHDDYPTKGISPEQRLWCAVIAQALTDAQNGSRTAREWLLFERENFVLACTLAGVSPFSVRTAARRLTSKKVND